MAGEGPDLNLGENLELVVALSVFQMYMKVILTQIQGLELDFGEPGELQVLGLFNIEIKLHDICKNKLKGIMTTFNNEQFSVFYIGHSDINYS